ncbi:MAG: hypothetical protein V3V59_03685 [Thermodesulfovibrionales bacterium]
MTEGFAVFVLMSNYFHDVATAMLMACGIAMWILLVQYEKLNDPSVKPYFLWIYDGMRKIVIFSIVWIMAGLVLRVATWRSFEWKNAVTNSHEQGLIAKYIIAVVIIITGAYVWIFVSRRIRSIKDTP